MAEHYGVPVDSVEYFTGNIEPSDQQRIEKLKLDLPPSVKVTPIGPGKCLSDMLAAGEIDAIYSATQPPSLGVSDNVTQLFPDFKAVEQGARCRSAPVCRPLSPADQSTTARPRSCPSCTSSSCAETCTSSTPGSPAPSQRPSRPPSIAATRPSPSAVPCATCCPGCRTTSRRRSGASFA